MVQGPMNPPGAGSNTPDWVRTYIQDSINEQRQTRKLLEEMYTKSTGQRPRGGGGGSTTDYTGSIRGGVDSLNSATDKSAGLIRRWSEGLMRNELGGASEKILKSLGVTAYAMDVLAERAVKTSNALFTMYNSGVVMYMDQLATAASNLGVDVGDLTKIMVRHSQVVAVAGIKQISLLGLAMKEATNNGTDLGMNLEQVTDHLLDYTEMLARTGRLQRMSTDQIIDGARQFAEQITLASQATGKNREQIMQEIKERNKQSDALALYATLTVAGQKQMDATSATLKEFGKGGDILYEAALQYQRTGSMAQVDDATRMALQRSGSQELFERAMRTTGEEQRRLFLQIGQNMQTSLARGGEGALIGVSGALGESMKIQGQFASDARNAYEAELRRREGVQEGRKTGAAGQLSPDETAAKILDSQQRYISAVAAADTQLNVFATNLTEKFVPAFNLAVDTVADEIEKLTKLNDKLKETSLEDMGLILLGAAGAGASAAYLSKLRTSMAEAGAQQTAGAAGNPPSPGSPATSRMRSGIPALLASLGLGYVLERGADFASAADMEKTAAAARAAGTTMQYGAGGGILGSLFGPRGTAAGMAIGGAYGLYQSTEDLLKLRGSKPGEEESITPPPSTELPATVPVAPVSETDLSIANTNSTLVDQMNIMIRELDTLITAVQDQTRRLESAYNRGAGNLTP